VPNRNDFVMKKPPLSWTTSNLWRWSWGSTWQLLC